METAGDVQGGRDLPRFLNFLRGMETYDWI